MGWPWFGMFQHFAHLPSRFCQTPICRTWQTVEWPKSQARVNPTHVPDHFCHPVWRLLKETSWKIGPLVPPQTPYPGSWGSWAPPRRAGPPRSGPRSNPDQLRPFSTLLLLLSLSLLLCFWLLVVLLPVLSVIRVSSCSATEAQWFWINEGYRNYIYHYFLHVKIY